MKQLFSNNISSLFLLLVLAFMTGCGVSSSVSSRQNNQGYTFQSGDFETALKVYHFSDDSTALYVALDLEKLLPARTSEQDPFLYKVKLDLEVDYDEESIANEKHEFFIVQEKQSEGDYTLMSKVKLPFAKGRRAELIIKTTDLNRNKQILESLVIHKEDKPSQDDILFLDTNNKPLLFNFTPNLSQLSFLAQRFSGEPVKILGLDNETKLPPSPHSGKTTTPPNPDVLLETTLSQNKISFASKPGYFTIQIADEPCNCGILVQENAFPKVQRIQDLAGPIRYITSKPEHQRISDENIGREEFEKFWLDCGGSKARGAKLIALYYTRVEEANFFFSNYKPGWKSDKGLIHIIFGTPSQIRTDDDTEIWYYGEMDNPNTPKFSFYLEDQGAIGKIWELKRNEAYKTTWDEHVKLWRAGRIF